MFKRIKLNVHAPVTFTAEEQAKVDEHLKELGYDGHASEVIKRIQGETKKEREAREAAELKARDLEGKVKTYEQTDEQRKAEQKKKDDEAAAVQKKLDDEKKTLDERIEGLKDELRAAAEKDKESLRAEIQTLQKERATDREELSKRDQRILLQSVIDAAKDLGIKDAALADRIYDLKDIKVIDGEPDAKAITDMIEKHAKDHPALYSTAEERARDVRGRFITPTPAAASSTGITGIDWDALRTSDPKAYEIKRAEFRAARNRL